MVKKDICIGVLFNPKKQAAENLAVSIEKIFISSGIDVWICSSWDGEKARSMIARTTRLICIGGDGTILKAARLVVPHSIPIIGINLGRLGFLTELSVDECLSKMPLLLGNKGWIDERMMLEVKVPAARHATKLYALNDAVKAYINSSLLTTYKADGLIAATATGSTGYSMAAGGPILDPQAQEIILQPIAAHLTLSTPVVVSAEDTLELQVQTDHHALLSIDGQIEIELKTGDKVKITKSPYTARFLRFRSKNFFYEKLVERLATRNNIQD
ncbi:MAG: NAD(+)/NADH kinase [Chloroflexi bacterium]|nr:NAD(+)/NADH kinase [Chloroflexota bacterium]